MFPSLPHPRHMPCPECGESVALEACEPHACDEERWTTFQLFQLRVPARGVFLFAGRKPPVDLGHLRLPLDLGQGAVQCRPVDLFLPVGEITLDICLVCHVRSSFVRRVQRCFHYLGKEKRGQLPFVMLCDETCQVWISY